MNNSKIALDNQDVFLEKEIDKTPILRKQESELVKIIEAIGRVSKSIDWAVLEEHIFDGLVISLERRLSQEANKGELNAPEVYRLQGQLMWARKYGDFNKLADVYRSELLNVKQQLNKTNPGTEPYIAPDTYGND
jgi:hypothetical protein